MKGNTKIILYLVLLITLSSCNKMLMSLYGINELKEISNSSLEYTSYKYFKNYNNQFYLDTAYSHYINNIVATNKPINTTLLSNTPSCYIDNSLSKLFQPIQILVFSKEGYLEKIGCNCDAGGFPNLNWKNAIKTMFSNPIDSVLTRLNYDDFSKYYLPLNNNIPNTNPAKPKMIVYWNKYIGRQSKRLIKLVNDKYASQYNIIHVNNDNYLFYYLK